MTANTGRTTSRIIRSRLRPRRSSQLFFGDGPVFVSGDVRASGAGTIFKAFSLMIYPTFACCWFALRAIAERRLFFNCTELLEHALDRSRRDSVKHGFHHVRAKIRQTVEQRSCCRLQVQTIGAPVIRIGAALDEPIVREPIEKSGQADRLQVEQVRKFRLLQALVPIDAIQHGPLCPGDAELAGPLIGIGFQQTGYIHDSKAKFALDQLLRHWLAP
jgi:hypothetical protein